jgi:2-dehydro-3-deoxy-D-gluconate 5-dehydrogenase
LEAKCHHGTKLRSDRQSGDCDRRQRQHRLWDCPGAGASWCHHKAPQDYTLEEWQQVLNTNLTGVFLCARAVYPYMVKAAGGKIINIGSMTSIFGSSVAPAYAASKGGVVQFTKRLALFWAKDNIQVNVILPGWIHTDLTASIASERYSFITSRIPHGRWGEPDELAGAAVFLASRASDYVTGIALPVDGGYTSM